MLKDQSSQNYYESKEKIKRSIGKTILIRILCFACCFILIWQGYGVYKNLAEKVNNVEGVEWAIPLSKDFDYEAEDAYITQKNLEEIELDLVTRQEKVKGGISSYYKTYFGVKDKNGKVIIQPRYDYLYIDEDGNYIMAAYHNWADNHYSELKNIVHYYNFDGSDYVRGNYCDGEFFQDGYAVVELPWEESEDTYFKKKILIINDKGEVVYETPYNSVVNIPGLKGCFVVYNENLQEGLDMLDEKKGIINSKGEILVPLDYYSIEGNKEQQIIYLKKIDDKGNEMLYCMDYQFNPIPVDETWEFRANHKFEYVNPTPKGVARNAYEPMMKEDIFKNARTVNEDENGWHIVDGNEEIIADFSDCIKMYDFSEGVSVVEYKDKIKYVDTSGKVLFETKKVKGYDLDEEYGGNYFSDGTIQFAEYRSSFLGNDYKVGLLDKTGKVLLPAEFDYIGEIINDGKDQQVIVRKNGSYGVVVIHLSNRGDTTE